MLHVHTFYKLCKITLHKSNSDKNNAMNYHKKKAKCGFYHFKYVV